MPETLLPLLFMFAVSKIFPDRQKINSKSTLYDHFLYQSGEFKD